MGRQKAVLKIAVRSIWLNWRHSLATLSAIALGFAAVSLFDGFMANMNTFIIESHVNRNMLGHVIIQKKNAHTDLVENPWTYTLDKSEQNFVTTTLSGDNRILAMASFLQLSGVISNGSANPIFAGVGYDVNEGLKFRGERWAWNAVAGAPLHLESEGSILLGTGLSRQMGYQFAEGERPSSAQLSVTTEDSQVNAVTLKPAGTVDLLIRQYNDRVLFMPLPTAQKLLDTTRISRFSVLLKDGDLAEAFIYGFQAKADKQGTDLQAIHWLQHPEAAAARGGLEILGMFRSLFLTVVVIIAVMSVANTMMKNINERIREIGMLRSIGFRPNDMILMFSTEGLLLGLLSCGFGLALTLGLAWLISNSGITFATGILSNAMPLKIDLSLSTWIVSMIAVSIITAGTSWFFSRRSANMAVAETLRHVA